MNFITLGPAAAGGRRVDADGRRVDADGQRAVDNVIK
jgi:hypothetical protein